MALLTRTELNERAAEAVAILPLGATEQHGPHLASGTDHLIVERIAQLAAESLNRDVDVIVAPTIPYGFSAHHLQFGATVTIAPSTLIAFLAEACRSLLASGFRRVFILNGHGGNDEIVRVVARQVGTETGALIAASSYWVIAWDRLVAAGVQEVGRLPGHAGAFETSIFSALFPDQALDSLPERPGRHQVRDRYYTDVHIEDEEVWTGSDGYSDNPASANVQTGVRAVAETVTAVAGAIRSFAGLRRSGLEQAKEPPAPTRLAALPSLPPARNGQHVQREFSGYRGPDERLAEFRTEVLGRMRRDDELVHVRSHDRVNLAAGPTTVVTVDSFLGTVNTDRVGDVYFPVDDSGAPTPSGLPFPVEDPDHPVLQELRERFGLATVAGTGTDVERAVRLRDWIKSLSAHCTPYRMPRWDALTILDRASRGVENFICIHYSVSLVQCCLALGMQARMINLHRGIAAGYVIGDEAVTDPPVDEHVVCEVWSREQQGWVMLDTDYDCHYERGGVAVSAYEIHLAFIEEELDQLTCRRGPHSLAGPSGQIENDEKFFAEILPSYYAHITVMMRNDFLSDADGPVPAVHLTDAETEPILWHNGSDMRLQPHLMGPVVVATPYTDRITLLTDGNDCTGWASADTPSEHWVDIALATPTEIGRIGLVWPEYASYYRTSRRLRIDAQVDGDWVTLIEIANDVEGLFTLHELPRTTTAHVRVRQPAGGGFRLHPDRMWLTQVELLAPIKDSETTRNLG